MNLDSFQIATMRGVLRDFWDKAGHAAEAPDALCDAALDGLKYRFLVKHWSSIYKGKPLWRYIEEDGLGAGGIDAILEDAMSVVAFRTRAE